MPERGDAPEGEPAVRKPRRCHLDTARREAPGPWRIGGRDDAGIHVLDANEEPSGNDLENAVALGFGAGGDPGARGSHR